MWLLLSAAISSILYRVGGQGPEENKLANSQYRDTGIPILLFLYLAFAVGVTWYLALIVALAVCGMIRTYWDFITGDDNKFLHGAGIGLCFIPLAYDGVSWLAIGAYSAILTLVMGGLNVLCTRVRIPGSVWVEELAGGAVIFLASPVLYLIK